MKIDEDNDKFDDKKDDTGKKRKRRLSPLPPTSFQPSPVCLLANIHQNADINDINDDDEEDLACIHLHKLS